MPPYSRGCERTFQRVQEMKMTVGGGSFSPEEIKYLKSLPAVAEATSKRITYTDDFKRYFLTRYNKGASPVRLFREAGLDPALIGYKRIERCLARWREAQDEILGAEASEPAQPWGGGYLIRGFIDREPLERQILRTSGARRRVPRLRRKPAANPISTYPPNAAPSSSPSPAKSRTMICVTC